MAAPRLAVIRRGLREAVGGGVEVGEQIAGRDDVDDVVRKDIAERNAEREIVVRFRSKAPKLNKPQYCGLSGKSAGPPTACEWEVAAGWSHTRSRRRGHQ